MSWRFQNDMTNALELEKRQRASIISPHDGYAEILGALVEVRAEIDKSEEEQDDDLIYDALVKVATLCMRTADDCGLTHEMDMQVRAEQTTMDGYPPDVE